MEKLVEHLNHNSSSLLPLLIQVTAVPRVSSTELLPQSFHLFHTDVPRAKSTELHLFTGPRALALPSSNYLLLPESTHSTELISYFKPIPRSYPCTRGLSDTH